MHGSVASQICGAGHRGCQTIVRRVVTVHRDKQPSLMNAASIRVSRLLGHVLSRGRVPYRILGTGLRRHRTSVITRTKQSAVNAIVISNRPMRGHLNAIAVTAGVTNHNASVGLASRIGTTKKLTVVNARHRRDHHISHRLHNHDNHRNSPNSSIFCMSLRSGLVGLFKSSHVSSVVSQLKFGRNRVVRGGVVSGRVRGTRGGIRRGRFNAHGRLLRCSSIVGGRHAIVCRGHHRTLVNRHVKVSVTGVV